MTQKLFDSRIYSSKLRSSRLKLLATAAAWGLGLGLAGVLAPNTADATEFFVAALRPNFAPMPGTWVKLQKPDGTLMLRGTGFNGAASFGDLPPGHYRLTFSYYGNEFDSGDFEIEDVPSQGYQVIMDGADISNLDWSKSVYLGVQELFEQQKDDLNILNLNYYPTEHDCETANPGWECSSSVVNGSTQWSKDHLALPPPGSATTTTSTSTTSTTTTTTIPLPAHLISPTSGMINQAASMSFQWSATPGALAYYLYVGTSVGTKNVIDTGEIQSTSLSVQATQLPVNTTLYARIYTKMAGGIWKASSDVSFKSAYVEQSALISPTSGAQISSSASSVSFQWSAAVGAQSYYLYVGTSPGLNNIINTGEIQTLSYSSPVSVFPVNQTLYARIYTKIAGSWYASKSDVSFLRVGVTKTTLTYPTSGLTNVDLTKNFTWSAVPGAQAYYLYVGTSLGAKNLIDTGEIQTTSYKAYLLPAGQTLYARVYTKLNGAWQASSDVSFQISGSGFLYPTNGDLSVSRSKFFMWSAISNAQAYYLYVGTSPGAKNVIDSGETQANSYGMQAIQPGILYYATIWTKINGIWKASAPIQFKAL